MGLKLNSFGKFFIRSRTNGEYNPNNTQSKEKMIAETKWFFTFWSFIIIPVTGPVKQVETDPKNAFTKEPKPQE